MSQREPAYSDKDYPAVMFLPAVENTVVSYLENSELYEKLGEDHKKYEGDTVFNGYLLGANWDIKKSVEGGHSILIQQYVPEQDCMFRRLKIVNKYNLEI